MTEDLSNGPTQLIPNLGAEEGDDGQPFARQPAVRVAARLWALLFGEAAGLWIPPLSPDTDWTTTTREDLWPKDLGPPPRTPAFTWPTASRSPVAAWLNTPSAEALARSKFSATLSGPRAESVRELHDKAFAVRASVELGLDPRGLAPWIEVLEPEDLADTDSLVRRLDRLLGDWPAWTERSFTLKPRLGSSGRGRVGGRDSVDTPAVRGALGRLARRGGAVFEPWLDRVGDYSVSLFVPGPEALDRLPLLLGSLEMWNSPSGVYKGHCGEFDSRGRVFSGDAQDEALRADAAAVAALARSSGFEGPCGVDALRYREPDAGDSNGVRLRMRSAVEFNARPTMGLVTIGLVRRALPRVREALELGPGERRGFALVYRDPHDSDWAERVREQLGADALILELARVHEANAPRPMLVFARTLEALRAARQDVFGS